MPPGPGERGKGPRLLEPRLVALLLAGCVLFGYPLPGLISETSDIGGIPALFFYFLVTWASFIGALAWLVQSHDGQRNPAPGTRRIRRE
jgi:hypothetical protein